MDNSFYKLGIIELFFSNRHSKDINVREHALNGYYICSTPISNDNFFNRKFIILIKNAYKLLYEDYISYELENHYFHKNFKNIIHSDNYFDVKIIKIIYINDFKLIIDKTFFLRILQRKWKKYFYKNFKYISNYLSYNIENYSQDDSDDSLLEPSDVSGV